VTRRSRKVHPQFVILELAVVALAGLAAWLLLPHLGAGRDVGLFAAGMAADRVSIIVLRHANKPRRKKPPARRTVRSRA